MPLADRSHALSLLVCPRCRSELEYSDRARRCLSAACRYSAAGSFPTVGPWPVLVDFERSILKREAVEAAPGAALAPGALRHRVGDRMPAAVRAWWKPLNIVAARNVDTLLSRLDGQSPVVLVIGGAEMGNGVDAVYAGEPTVIAFDIYGTALTQVIADAHQIPLRSGTVDAVVIQAVLEHVLDPDQVVREIHRVLRPGGLVYAETPFLQQVHAGAYDFTRYTASGHRWLFRAFEEIDAGPVAGPGTQMLWSIDHLTRGLVRSGLAGRLMRAAFSWLRLLDRLVPAPFAVDAASACFFLGRRADRELTPREIAEYYRGAQRSRARRESG
jgi:SAM-dependent methyltransferase